ncbi:MAG: AAA domain-containing protein [Planctomycetes bacterium]|nr:AAA domain-containing protein [Planctomycetota bacterium]
MAEKKKFSIVTQEQLAPAAKLAQKMLDELDRILLGRTELHRMVLVGILSQGHILLEGVPGVGKTALVKALSELMDLNFNRIQFTPDLMPSDIVGTHILQDNDDGKRQMCFEAGPVFTNILLADEINRASPKTQSALLESMQERSVTLLGQTRKLPKPFFVLASQNPIELEGTYPLPEAQLDRFLFKLQVTGADVDVMDRIISTRRRGEPPVCETTVDADKLNDLFEMMDMIFLPRPVARYISRLVAATHPQNLEATSTVNSYINYGASPRAAIAIAEAGRAYALFAARPTVGFEDVRAVASAVLNHRLILNYKARFDKIDSFTIVDDLLETLDEAGLDLPDDIAIAES